MGSCKDDTILEELEQELKKNNPEGGIFKPRSWRNFEINF